MNGRAFAGGGIRDGGRAVTYLAGWQREDAWWWVCSVLFCRGPQSTGTTQERQTTHSVCMPLLSPTGFALRPCGGGPVC